jgi:hypothetical protein
MIDFMLICDVWLKKFNFKRDGSHEELVLRIVPVHHFQGEGIQEQRRVNKHDLMDLFQHHVIHHQRLDSPVTSLPYEFGDAFLSQY